MEKLKRIIMKKTVLILGAGRMVKAMAYDLHKDFSVTIADINQSALAYLASKFEVKTNILDVTNAVELTEFIKPFDLIIGAVPGHLGYNMLKTVLLAGKTIVDISFAPEDALELDALAKENKALALVDIGVAPGLSNLMLGHMSTQFSIKKFTCMVGGLPVHKQEPFQYKAPFSPIDVIEEYTRPARIKRNGKTETVEALSEPETIHFNKIGTLEGFITDGLRSLLHTMNIPNMVEKTLRYPGHRDLMEVFKTTGLFDPDKINVAGVHVAPVDVTAAMLLPKWKLEEDEPEFTAMTIDLEGIKDQSHVKKKFELLDYYDAESGLSSMARTTGFTCASAARLVLSGAVQKSGVIPPELLGLNQEYFTFITTHLANYNIGFKEITI